ncbi:DUF2335 domain-containing protein [Leptospira interrogans]|nr:DUF2335 domain-containing protein [Leptospira interrogans]
MKLLKKNINLGRSKSKALVVGMGRAFDFFGNIDDHALKDIFQKSDSEFFKEDMEMIGKDFNRAFDEINIKLSKHKSKIERKILRSLNMDELNPKQKPTPILKDNTTNVKHSFTSAEFYQGPLPPPEKLEKYESILPGLADRIVAMAEKQLDHRTKNEQYIIQKSFDLQEKGLYFGGGVCLLVISVGGVLIYNDPNSGWGLSLVLTPLVALVAAFIYEKSINKSYDGDDSVDD